MTTPAYPCADVPEIAEAAYSRLCPRDSSDWDEFEPDHLRRLALAMQDSGKKRAARAHETKGIITVPAGYVYFGQFIDHDITRDTRQLFAADPDVARVLNHRTPSLDLDLLYGKDPSAVPCIYEADGEQLKLDLTNEVRIRGETIEATLDDLPRVDGTAVVIDPRSDENLIIAQLHVLFAKFHNRALRLLQEQRDLVPQRRGEALFEQVRRFVTWHYQWIVLFDFLPCIARLAVLDELNRGNFLLYARPYTPDDCPVALPVEFTVAAFRFGHSMVQDRYELNRHVGIVNSSKIIKMTKRGGGIADHLPASHVLDWRLFLTGLEVDLNPAQNIDTFITEALYDLPGPSAGAFRLQLAFTAADLSLDQKMVPSLPETTLKRGSLMRLPSGQEFARFFADRIQFPIIEPSKMAALPDDPDFPGAMRERTPLWYYLLREAAIEQNPEPPVTARGARLQKLGTMGSRIVAETLYQLIRADANSFVHAGWAPPKFTFRGRKWWIRTLPELARFAAGKI